MRLSIVLFALFLVGTASAQFDDPIVLHAEGVNVATKVRSGDINGDGTPELLLMNTITIGYYDLLANTSLEPYSWDFSAIGLSLNGQSLAFEVEDLNADGRDDVILAAGAELIIIFPQEGGGYDNITFEIEDQAYYSRNIGVGDIDGDGDMDVAFGINGILAWVENIDQFADSEYHEISSSQVGLRGAICMDVDNDGKSEVFALSGGIGIAVRMFEYNDGDWDWQAVSGSTGGVYGADVSDCDGDGDLDLGCGANYDIFVIDGGDLSVSTTDFSDGFAEGGEFYDIDGDGILEYCVIAWPSGTVIYADMDENGELIGLFDTGIQAANAHDLEFYDINNDGYDDMFLCYYNGSNTLSVCLGNGAVGVPIEPETLITFSAVSHNGILTLKGDHLPEATHLNIYNLNGQLVLQEQLNTTSTTTQLTNPLTPGIYIAEIANETWRSRVKFFAE